MIIPVGLFRRACRWCKVHSLGFLARNRVGVVGNVRDREVDDQDHFAFGGHVERQLHGADGVFIGAVFRFFLSTPSMLLSFK